jgi:betaine reductase
MAGQVPGGQQMRIVHYVNQFFAGIGGEEQAGIPPASQEGAVGPGRRLATLLGDGFEFVATVYCGDDYAAGRDEAVEEILALVQSYQPDLLIVGPAFTSGRYGLACARLAAAAAHRGLAVVASMHAENPGLGVAAPAVVVASGATAREMGPSLARLQQAVGILAAGGTVGTEQGRIGTIPRLNQLSHKDAASRAVDLLLGRLAGDRSATEIPTPRFESVEPAPPVDPSSAKVAILTEGGLVPIGNPDRLESARATKWLRYDIPDGPGLVAGQYQSVHGGFSTVAANADPNRMLPLDAARELESAGQIKTLWPSYLTTVGNGTSVAMSTTFGVEWAAELHREQVQAVVLTAT